MLGFVKQFLEHGKLITKANFPTFVETWNWLVEGFGNLRGDADVNGATGHIKVDLTDPKHPVVRLVNANFGGDDDNAIKKDGAPASNQFAEGAGVSFTGVDGEFVPRDFKVITADGEKAVKILATLGIEITEKQLAEGDGIKLTTSADGKTITISATAQSGGGVGTIDYVCDVKYDMSDYCLKKLMAHTNFSTGTTTYGSNYSATKAGGTWENFAEGAQTVPMT